MASPAATEPSSAVAGFFSAGFRPFFLFGALQPALMMALWVPWFLGLSHLPSAMPPVAWHQHELMFGYVPAVIAGFLLTAVPNWTGRKPLSGLPLVLLFVLWLAGRGAIACSDWIGAATAMAVAAAFLPVLALIVLRELVLAGNRRNYKVVVALGALFAAELLFFYEVDRYGFAEFADRMAIGTIIMLVTIIGGRIIPAFTGNWLRQQNPGGLPPSFDRFDMACMVLAFAALTCWLIAARIDALAWPAGMLMLAAGTAQFARQVRWAPLRTFAEPLVTVLHVAFFFVPAGFLLTGAALLSGDPGLRTAGVHAWTVGAIGGMTLAVMTRATRGHSGQMLHAPASTVLAIYVPILLAALARIGAALAPELTMVLLPLSGTCWIVAFLGFVVLYGPLLLRKA
ncbi:NnrS family protein [Mycoplana ramosa]|uniref:NnrS family protein n=1 Tax=Mycoplana ramosa TaxID=40837 RepID=A0ABW3YYB2_MYCRA